MEDKSLELLSEEGRKFHEEFTQCQSMEEIEELEKRWNKLNESRENNEIPHLDMTYEEFLIKYHCVDAEEMRKKYGI